MRQWKLSHPGRKESQTNLNFSYAETCSQRQGNNEFWTFYFQEDPSGARRTFNFFGDDVAVWFGKWVHLVASSDGWQNGVTRSSPEFEAAIYQDAVAASGSDALPHGSSWADDAAGKASRIRPFAEESQDAVAPIGKGFHGGFMLLAPGQLQAAHLVPALDARYPGVPWISFKASYLPLFVTEVGAHCFEDKIAARSKCMRTDGCGGINRQHDECGGSGWTLRGSATPVTQELPTCLELGQAQVCTCEVLNRGAIPAIPARKAPSPSSSTGQLLWFGCYFAWYSIRSALSPDLDLVRSMKDTFSLLVLMMTIWYLTLLVAYHRVFHRLFAKCRRSGASGAVAGASGCITGGLSVGTHAGLVVAAALYTDWMSGVLHVVLDNPILNTWPIIGPEARAFQGHHFDPTGVARGPILDMVREDHSLVFLVLTVFAIGRPTSAALLTFGLHFCWMTHLMMASHRWSHTHPKYLPSVVRAMQDAGVIMSIKHHSKHHASYDSNFCIFSGICNPLLNVIVKYLVPWQSPLWVFILGFFISLPVVGTNDSIQMWAKNQASRVISCLVRLVTRYKVIVTRQQLADGVRAAERAGNRRGFTVTYNGQQVSTAGTRVGAAAMAAASMVLAEVSICRTIVASGSSEGMLLFIVTASGAALACSTFAIASLALVEGVGRKTKVQDPTFSSTSSHPTSSSLWWDCMSGAQAVISLQQAQLCPSASHDLRRALASRDVCWWLHIAVIVLVNAAVISAASFEGYVYSKVTIQVLLGCNVVTSTYALGKLPGVTLALENPVLMLFREHWALVPGGLQRLSKRCGCLSVYAPSYAQRCEWSLPL
jgi:hypothetical protein